MCIGVWSVRCIAYKTLATSTLVFAPLMPQSPHSMDSHMYPAEACLKPMQQRQTGLYLGFDPVIIVYLGQILDSIVCKDSNNDTAGLSSLRDLYSSMQVEASRAPHQHPLLLSQAATHLYTQHNTGELPLSSRTLMVDTKAIQGRQACIYTHNDACTIQDSDTCTYMYSVRIYTMMHAHRYTWDSQNCRHTFCCTGHRSDDKTTL